MNMNPAPEQIAARLMSPASESALWTYTQVKALLIKAVEEERAAQALPARSHQGAGEAMALTDGIAGSASRE
jgi:hypothetical protein